MANPIIQTKNSIANTYQILYELPNTGVTYAIVAVKAVNRDTANSVPIWIAVGPTATSGSPTPATNEHIEYNTTLPPGGGMERGSIILAPGEKVVVRANSNNVSFRLHGLSRVTSTQSVQTAIVSPGTGNWSTAYTVPSNVTAGAVNFGTYHFSFLNVDAVNVITFDAAIAPTATPANEKFIEKATALNPNGDGIIHTCNIMQPGERVLVNPDNNGLAVRVSGIIDIVP